MTKPVKKLPRLPAYFLTLNAKAAAIMTIRRIVSLICAVSSIAWLAHQDFHWFPAAIGYISLSLWGGASFQNLALIGHEASHFNLHPNRMVSVVWGVLTSALVPLHFDIGFSLEHLKHHRFANSDKDPDTKVFQKFNNLFSRLFLARSAASRSYLRLTWLVATKRAVACERSKDYQLSCNQLQFLARLNLVASFVILVTYGLAIYYFPVTLGTGLAASYLGAVLLSGIRPYLEHGGTSHDCSTVARTWETPLSGLIFGNINYHHAHHLFPAVPAYRMGALQKWLEQNGHINDTAVKSSTYRQLWEVASKSQYGITTR